MLVSHALPIVAAAFPSLARELSAMASLLEGQPGGLTSMPASVLAAGLEAIAFGGYGAGTYQRRWAALEAAVLLHDRGDRPDMDDLPAAVGLWAGAVARAASSYRAHATSRESAPCRKSTTDHAPSLAGVVAVLGADLAVLTAAAEVVRLGGRKVVFQEMATYLAHTGAKSKPFAPPPPRVRPDPDAPRAPKKKPGPKPKLRPQANEQRAE